MPDCCLEVCTSQGAILYESYDYRLVTLSVIFAALSAYAALDLGGRITAAAQGRLRLLWLVGGAFSMGVGVWGMHYIGMLAFSLRVPVMYHYPTVVLSLGAAIAASAVALFTVSRARMSSLAWIGGGVVMAVGIIAMHFVGMAAMRVQATMEFDLWPLLLAIGLAVGGSLAALRLVFQIRQEEKTTWHKPVSALIMGSAIALMHYSGMWSAVFRETPVKPDLTDSLAISTLGLAAISGVTFMVLLVAIGTSYLDRFVTAKMKEVSGAKESELLFRTLAGEVPQMIWAANPDGMHEFFGTRWYDYTGMTAAQSRGVGWKAAVHPDDLPDVEAKWEQTFRTGQPFENEYRFRSGSDGSYRWFLGRANPIRDEQGQIVRWFGTCTDIEDQKQNQQILEQEIKERTEELADANTRLQEEMWEKDLARRQLDEQNEKMMGELTERSQRATMLAKMGELLQSCITKDEVFAAAFGFAPKIFPTSRGAVALLNAERSLAEVSGSWQDCRLPITVFEPNGCWALRTGHPHLVVAGDPTAPCGHAVGVTNSYLCIPIMAQGEAIGILHFQATDEAPSLADSELSFRTTFAGQVGLSVANIRLREALRTQSIRDPLTGLFNRRYLEEMMTKEARRATRASYGVGLLILDLDHFKRFNDTYGHDAGDTVLRETAALLIKSVRAEDIVCRFGGEEFVVILPMADLKASQARAERIRSQMSELTVLHQGQSLGKITVSVGVSALPDHGSVPKELLELADAALYRAKREGRDRVVVADLRAVAETQPSPVEVGKA